MILETKMKKRAIGMIYFRRKKIAVCLFEHSFDILGWSYLGQSTIPRNLSKLISVPF
jgi:hypothetical protein